MDSQKETASTPGTHTQSLVNRLQDLWAQLLEDFSPIPRMQLDSETAGNQLFSQDSTADSSTENLCILCSCPYIVRGLVHQNYVLRQNRNFCGDGD